MAIPLLSHDHTYGAVYIPEQESRYYNYTFPISISCSSEAIQNSGIEIECQIKRNQLCGRESPIP